MQESEKVDITSYTRYVVLFDVAWCLTTVAGVILVEATGVGDMYARKLSAQTILTSMALLFLVSVCMYTEPLTIPRSWTLRSIFLAVCYTSLVILELTGLSMLGALAVSTNHGRQVFEFTALQISASCLFLVFVQAIVHSESRCRNMQVEPRTRTRVIPPDPHPESWLSCHAGMLFITCACLFLLPVSEAARLLIGRGGLTPYLRAAHNNRPPSETSGLIFIHAVLVVTRALGYQSMYNGDFRIKGIFWLSAATRCTFTHQAWITIEWLVGSPAKT